MDNKGKFIVFEGIDGSGKSTQIKFLADKLKEAKIAYEITAEPSEGPVGVMIRQILTGERKMDNRVIAALFAADRLDHILNEEHGLLNKIENGTTVICDRYYFSSYAYNGVDMPMEWVIAANSQSSRLLKPTVNVFIDLDPDVALERIARNRQRTELFEKKSRLEKVRENYFEVFEKMQDETVIIIDGNQAPEMMAEEIWQKIKGYLC
ncbi:MAG: dTMP kinase [bacterium]|nr:dTMP kinase [bacterium]